MDACTRKQVNHGNVDQVEDEGEEGISQAEDEVEDTRNIPTPVYSDTMATSPSRCTYYAGAWANSDSVRHCMAQYPSLSDLSLSFSLHHPF